MSRLLAASVLAALAIMIYSVFQSSLDPARNGGTPVAYDTTAARLNETMIPVTKSEARAGYLDGRPVPDGFAGPRQTRWMHRPVRG